MIKTQYNFRLLALSPDLEKLLKTLESVIIATKIRLKMNCIYYSTVINTMI